MKVSVLCSVLSFGTLLKAQFSDDDAHLVVADSSGCYDAVYCYPGDIVTVTFNAPTATAVALVLYEYSTVDDSLYSTAYSTAISGNF